MPAPNEKAPAALERHEDQMSKTLGDLRTLDTNTLAALVAIQSNQISILAAELESLKRTVAWLKSEEQVRQWLKLGAS